MLRTFGFIALALLAACMQPVAEQPPGGGASSGTSGVDAPAKIAATRSAPAVVFVVDGSGSMQDPAGQGQSQSKWQDLVGVLGGPASASGSVFQLQSALALASGEAARLGLVTFGGGASDSCAPGAVRVAPQANVADAIDDVLRTQSPQGGTPTAASLKVAGQALASAQAEGRAAFIILLTDGAPNCNAQWAGEPSACQDDQSGGCASTGCCYTGPSAESACTPQGCLDRDETVATVGSLFDSDIETFVVGFGAALGDEGSLSLQTLDAMAEAGGANALYRASSPLELSTSLDGVRGELLQRCRFALAAAAPSRFVSVVLQSDTETRTVAASHATLSADRQRLSIDDPACAAVPGHAVSLTFE